jgi:uncharacterized protein (TIGR04255 family)
MPNPTPEFEHPPLDEMALGVQFDPLLNFRTVHFGLYWTRIRGEYPHTEDQPPLAPVVEPAEITPPPTVPMAISLPVPSPARCWFLNEGKTQLLQVQRDRFCRNWRQQEGNERYPRFGPLKQEFERAWKGFQTFVSEEHLGPLNVNQCELSYVNHIGSGKGWSELGELEKVFTLLRPRAAGGFLPPPETLSWQARYKLPEGRGRLHVSMDPAFRGRDLKLVLLFNLTARGVPSGGSPEQILAWFDLAHEWAVGAFAELTGPVVHALWGIKP